MRVIVLAAGKGARIQQSDLPKCLLRVEGRELLDYLLRPLLRLNPEVVTICVGYQGDLIRSFVRRAGYRLTFDWVENEHYLTTNNSYTLALALEIGACDDIMIVNGDNLLDPRILYRLSAADVSILPFITKNSYDEEDMKILYRAGREGNFLTRIDKNIPVADAMGESIGVRRFTGAFAQAFVQSLREQTSTAQGLQRYYTDAIQNAVDSGQNLSVVDVSRFGYAEVDFDRDLAEARPVAAGVNRMHL